MTSPLTRRLWTVLPVVAAAAGAALLLAPTVGSTPIRSRNTRRTNVRSVLCG